MNTTSLNLRWPHGLLVLGLITATSVGCGDNLPRFDEATADAAPDVADAADTTDIGEGCPGALGCACAADDTCDSGYCHPASGDKQEAQCATPCETAGDKGCNDGNPCTTDLCDASTDSDKSSTCSHTAVANGVVCNDGDACTTSDVCGAGACAGAAKDCGDGDPCTTDTCEKATGCSHGDDDGKACDDGDACTGGKAGDACKGGKCAGGAAVDCDDANPCTTDSCDKTTGCGHTALDGGGCDDGSACTGTKAKADTCVKGVCEPGAPVVCDDANPCTTDACDAAAGCTVTDADSTPCDDGNACTLGDTCKSGGCIGGKPLSCDDGNPCTTDACDPDGKTSGNQGCVNTALDGTPCDDGSACTGAKDAAGDDADHCVKGACTPGAPKSCDDANPCTTDACEPAAGCTITNDDGAKCVPGTGNKCDTGGLCAGGACKVVQQVGCDDGNPCTADSCDQTTGLCVYKSASDGAQCSDGNPCTDQDACKSGVCAAKPKVCDDDNVCTADACDPAPATGPGGCTTKPLDGKSCSDGTVCTSGDVCAAGTCKGGKALSCDDNNPCTIDLCDKAKGCASTQKTGDCDDGNACTDKDTCKAGWCNPGGLKVCDDANACTTDSCDPKQGCKNDAVAASCNDGNLCTVADTCDKGSCKSGTTQTCDDNNDCTADTCDPKIGCQSVTTKAPCSDGDVCTVGDACKGDLCVPGAGVKDCDDKNACTVDVCDPTKGCVVTDSLNACTDGDACTVGDSCKSGKCVAGASQLCNDGNPCSDDSCDAKKGCIQVPNSKACDDGNACTLGDACKAGYCQGGGQTKTCDDKNPCTDDFCDPAKGCSQVLTTKLCNDGDACTVDDACVSGKCKGGSPKDCSDDNTCTDDVCDQTTGCKHTNNTKNPFTPINDSGAEDSGKWAFSATKGAGAFTHVGAGYYRLAAGVVGETYAMTLKAPIDLACTGKPTLYIVDRYAVGTAVVETSLDGKAWKTLATHTGSDYVWRRRYWDLGAFVGKKLYLRLLSKVTSADQWWDIRGIEIKEKEPLPKKVAWGTTFGCSDLRYVGPAFNCDASESPYQVRYHGVVQEPDTNLHPNTAVPKMLFDTKGVTDPAVSFEERSYAGGLWVDVREPEGAWKQVYARGAVSDYVWRPRTIYLTAYKGKVLEFRFRATMGTTAWTHIRSVKMFDEAPPTLPAIVKAPLALKACADWQMDGTAWLCDNAQTIFKLAYVGDPSVDYNTNGYAHAVQYDKRIDLSAMTSPELTFEHRYYYGTMYVYLSTNGTSWTTVYSHGNGSDYLWRQQRLDLSSWQAKKTPIYVRILVYPYTATGWGHLRNIKIEEQPKALDTVAYGTKLNSCGWWSWEGPSWKCDPTETKWLFRVDGVDTVPDPGGYWQYNTLQRWIDVPNKGQPSFQIEYRRNYSYIQLQVSTNGTSWSNLMGNTGSAADFVWRPLRADLSSYKGKKIMLRIGAIPSIYGRWIELRKPAFQEFNTWPTVKFGGMPVCQDWLFEGTAWTCGSGSDGYQLRYVGSTEQPSPDYSYHYATRAALIDLKDTKNPTMYFEASRTLGYLRIFVWGPEDSYQQLFDTSNTSLPFYRRYAVDLTKFAGRKIYVRLGALPYGATASGKIRNLIFKEREAVKVVKYTHAIQPDDWWMEGGWHYDTSAARYEQDGTVINVYHDMYTKMKIDLTGLTAPQLSFKQTNNNVTRYVYVSEDGATWQNAQYIGAGYDPVERVATVDLTKWKDKAIYLSFRGHVGTTDRWWRLRDFEFHEPVVVNTVPAGTTLATDQFTIEGLWKWLTLEKAYGMNYGVGGSTQDKLLLNTYQSLTATAAWDITKLKAPTLIFDERATGSYSYHRLEFSLDGADWKHLGYGSQQATGTAFRRATFDLSTSGAKSTIRVRFRGYPSTSEYHWTVKNVRLAEPPMVTVLQPGTTLKSTDVQYYGGWTYGSGYFEKVLKSTNEYNFLEMRDTAYNLSGTSKPVVVFEEGYLQCNVYVYCSHDGGASWIYVNGLSQNGQYLGFKQRTVSLASCANKPQVQLRFHVTQRYSPGEYWRIRNIVVLKQ